VVTGGPGGGGSGGGTGDLTKAAADTYYDAVGAASSTVAGHVAAADPHPAYLTQVEGDARYATVAASGITKTQGDTYYDALGAATSAVAGHTAAIDPHGDRAASAAAIIGHTAASDPHGDRAAAVASLGSHVAGVDPHGDRAWATGQFIPSTQLDAASGVAILDSGRKVAIARIPQGANGVLVLDGSGLVPTSALPPLAINDVSVVVDQAAMLALTAQRGDMAIRSDSGKTYVLSADTPSVLSAWKEVLAAGQVTSVAGRTGIITLAISDVAGLAAAIAGKEDVGVAATAVATHVAAVDPHGDRAATTAAVSAHTSASDPHGDRAAATAALTTHAAAADPHPVYLTQTEGDARYAGISAARVLLPNEISHVFVGGTQPTVSEPYIWYDLASDGSYVMRMDLGRPLAPTAVTPTSGDASISLAWTAPTSAGMSAITLYTVEKSADSGVTWTSAGTSSITSLSVTGLTNGTAYVFRVKASNTYGVGPVSTTSAAVTPAGVPSAPTAPSATGSSSSVALAWTAPPANGSAITDYIVEYSSNAGASWSTFADGTSTLTSATVTGLTNGTAYIFRIKAVNAVGTSTAGTSSASVTPASTGSTRQFMSATTELQGVSTAASVATAIAATTALAPGAAGAGAGYFGDYFDGSFYQFSTLLLDFDTSAIGAGETVTSVTLEIAGDVSPGTDTGGVIEVYAFDFGAGAWRSATQLAALLASGKRVATKAFTSSLGGWSTSPTTYVTFANDGTNFLSSIVKGGHTRLYLIVDTNRTGSPTNPSLQVVPYKQAATSAVAFAPRLTVVTV
jgi:hypothetical protein